MLEGSSFHKLMLIVASGTYWSAATICHESQKFVLHKAFGNTMYSDQYYSPQCV